MPTLSVVGITAASVVFGPWVPVTPETILQEVSPFHVGSYGSYAFVQRLPKSSPLPAACAIVEAGRVVGYRLTCSESE